MKNNIPSFVLDSMKPAKLKILNGIIFLTSQLLFNHCWAALTGDQTATMNFTGIPAAVYGWANEINNGSYIGLCQRDNCFVQNGIVAGVVHDPIDNSAHIHGSFRVGSATNAAAQYHPDSSGLYVRMADLSKFSLKSLYLDFTASGSSTGQIVIYGYSEAINPGILSNAGFLSTGVAGEQKFNPSDPEGGNVPYLISLPIDNNKTNKGAIDFTGKEPEWTNIEALWITFKDFNHSPTKSYPSIGTETVTDEDGNVEIIPVYPYPNFDIRIDQITLGSACQPTLQITIH